MARRIKFFFQIDELTHKPGRAGQANNQRHWWPSEHSDACDRIPGLLYCWNHGQVHQVLRDSSNQVAFKSSLPLHDRTAVFTQFPDTLHFLAVGYDEEDTNEYCDKGWQELGFSHGRSPINPNSGLSTLEIVGSKPHLIAPGASWIKELFPEQYQYHPQHPNESPPPESAGLAGKLTLILAIIAFSCSPEKLEYVLKRSLTRGEWNPHNQLNGSKSSSFSISE